MWLMTANPVTGRAESQVPVAVFTTHEGAMTYVAACRLPAPERVDGFRLTFRDGSLLRWFNGSSIGDWYAPESAGGGWCVNPCMFDVQLIQLRSDVTPEMVAAKGLLLDPERSFVAPSTAGGSETSGGTQ